MAFFRIDEGTAVQRSKIAASLEGMGSMPVELADRIVTAWTSVWNSSGYADAERFPYSPLASEYPLLRHTNDVIRLGQALAAQASALWSVSVDPAILYSILALHDIDKPLLYARNEDGVVATTPLYKEVPHGVVGAFLLRDLGFADIVVSTVATHAVNAPFHGRNAEAWILHYADMFATDHILPGVGGVPFYLRQRH